MTVAQWVALGQHCRSTIRCFSLLLPPQGFHTIAEALSAMSNILLVDQTGDSSYSIETTNYPLPNSVNNKVCLDSVYLECLLYNINVWRIFP